MGIASSLSAESRRRHSIKESTRTAEPTRKVLAANVAAPVAATHAEPFPCAERRTPECFQASSTVQTLAEEEVKLKPAPALLSGSPSPTKNGYSLNGTTTSLTSTPTRFSYSTSWAASATPGQPGQPGSRLLHAAATDASVAVQHADKSGCGSRDDDSEMVSLPRVSPPATGASSLTSLTAKQRVLALSSPENKRVNRHRVTRSVTLLPKMDRANGTSPETLPEQGEPQRQPSSTTSLMALSMDNVEVLTGVHPLHVPSIRATKPQPMPKPQTLSPRDGGREGDSTVLSVHRLHPTHLATARERSHTNTAAPVAVPVAPQPPPLPCFSKRRSVSQATAPSPAAAGASQTGRRLSRNGGEESPSQQRCLWQKRSHPATAAPPSQTAGSGGVEPPRSPTTVANGTALVMPSPTSPLPLGWQAVQLVTEDDREHATAALEGLMQLYAPHLSSPQRAAADTEEGASSDGDGSGGGEHHRRRASILSNPICAVNTLHKRGGNPLRLPSLVLPASQGPRGAEDDGANGHGDESRIKSRSEPSRMSATAGAASGAVSGKGVEEPAFCRSNPGPLEDRHNSSVCSVVSCMTLAGTEEYRYQRALGSVSSAIADADRALERVEESAAEMRQLVETWNAITKDHFKPFAEEVFDSMLTKNPDYKELFFSSSTEQQSLATLGMVAKAVYAYTKTEDMLDLLKEIGAFHALYGVDKVHFIAIRDAFLKVYEKYVSPKVFSQSIRAWRVFWRVVVELLTYGRASLRAQHYLELRKRRWFLELQAFYAELTERQRATEAEAPRQHMFMVTLIDFAVEADPFMRTFLGLREPVSADRSFESIGRIISNLDDEELAQQYVMQLCHLHAAYKLTSQVMISLRPIFLRTCEFYMSDHDLWRRVPTMRRTLAEWWDFVSFKWSVGWSEMSIAANEGSPLRSQHNDDNRFPASSNASPLSNNLMLTDPHNTGDASSSAFAFQANKSPYSASPNCGSPPTVSGLGNADTRNHVWDTLTAGLHPRQHDRSRRESDTSLDAMSQGSPHGSRPRPLKGLASRAPHTGDPIAIMFTDIEASTKLWEARPEAMQEAVKRHNVIIRGLIADYGGYEVKTIGDSFMIVAKSTFIALQIALGIQLEMMRQPIAKGFSMSAAVPRPQGGGDMSCWRDDSIRVRVGIHYCTEATAVYDNVHERFDYYGPSVNCAARVESAAAGGQILMSDEAVESLTDTQFYTEPHSRYLQDFKASAIDPKLTLAEITRFQDCGLVRLKGIGKPVHLFSVFPAVLAGRVFEVFSS